MKLRSTPVRSGFNLGEHFILLSLGENGKFLTSEHTVRLGLAGATLADLARRGKITVGKDLLVPTNTADTESLESPLHEVLEIIRNAPQEQDAEQWVNRLSTDALLDAYIEGMVQRDTLEIKKTKFLGLFPTTRMIRNGSFDALDMQAVIREILFAKRGMDLLTGPVLYLLFMTDLLRRRFPDLRKRDTEKILRSEQMPIQTSTSKSVYEVLQATENAIAEGLTASRGGASGMRG